MHNVPVSREYDIGYITYIHTATDQTDQSLVSSFLDYINGSQLVSTEVLLYPSRGLCADVWVVIKRAPQEWNIMWFLIMWGKNSVFITQFWQMFLIRWRWFSAKTCSCDLINNFDESQSLSGIILCNSCTYHTSIKSLPWSCTLAVITLRKSQIFRRSLLHCQLILIRCVENSFPPLLICAVFKWYQVM